MLSNKWSVFYEVVYKFMNTAITVAYKQQWEMIQRGEEETLSGLQGTHGTCTVTPKAAIESL